MFVDYVCTFGLTVEKMTINSSLFQSVLQSLDLRFPKSLVFVSPVSLHFKGSN